MPKLTAADELFVHQIPEPLPNVVTHHDHWRESLFFVMHPREEPGDVVILTLAHFPKQEEMDSLQLGRIGGRQVFARHARPYDGDPHTMAVGPVSIDIVEPYQTVRLVVDAESAPVGMDVTFTARTQAVALRRGTMKAGHEIIWDQSHMIQSGTYTGTFTHNGKTYGVDDWWGQRDHSWGIRDHQRVPMWMWLAIQLPDGMFSVWNWEYANGARVYTDGAFAPADGGDPIAVVGFRHELHWTGEDGKQIEYGLEGADVRGLAGHVDITLEGGKPIEYGLEGADVRGLAGHVDITLEGGKTIGVDAEGTWAAPYGRLGGGLNQMAVRTDDGRSGTAIYEITGAHHHRYFPVARADNLPPG